MSSAALPLTQALDACSGELAALAARCERLQELVSASRLADQVEAAQDLDLVTQSLAALAGYVAGLSAAARPEWTVDACAASAAVSLSALADRLLGMTAAADDAGELEIFGAAP